MSAAIDWSDDAFFEDPELGSVDGATTSAGHLWHTAPVRWGHSMHTMCSYHGMFPAKLAHYFIQRYSQPGQVVLDPFSGRGTVALQARVEGRRVVANDLSPLAHVLTTAKADPPAYHEVLKHLSDLEREYKPAQWRDPKVSHDIRMLYHRGSTLPQLCFLRDALLKEAAKGWSPAGAMIMGSLAGIMHGAHRRDGSSQYLSISMPNTFSMAPSYVAKYINEYGLVAPEQNVFECLRDKIARLYLDAIDGPAGKVFDHDAVHLMTDGTIPRSSVDLVVTSPPYLQVVNYGTANWIRLWLLGVEGVARDSGEGRRSLDAQLDHRHTYATYEKFVQRMLRGLKRVLTPHGVAVVVIGDVADPGKQPIALAERIWEAVGASSGLRLIETIADEIAVDKKVSRIWGETKGQATSRDFVLVLAHAKGNPSVRADVEWDEPYKDGGPDAAHNRCRSRI